jgi:hypothetical protein
VLDQFGFMQEVLDGRVEEENIAASKLSRSLSTGNLDRDAPPGPASNGDAAPIVASGSAAAAIDLARALTVKSPLLWLQGMLARVTNLRTRLAG